MKPFYLFLLLFLLWSCNPTAEKLKYSTSKDALEFYQQGWVQIMDEGRYGAAEDSYRKALELDPNFLVGKSVLARLTLDLEERLKFEEELFKKSNQIAGDERLLLDVYNALVHYTNLRDQGLSASKSALSEALQLAEKNLQKLIHKYPKKTYLKAEYIEILHSLYGPQRALDSMAVLLLPEQKTNPFLLGASASMHAELDQFEIAMEQAKILGSIVKDNSQPKTYAVYAFILLEMKDLLNAKYNADKAYQLDPRNLDASRLKEKIDQRIAQEKNKQTTAEY